MALSFHHQSSGGRGEYEVTGSAGDVSAATLDGFGFRLDTRDYGVKETDLILSQQGGKRRLRSTAAGGMLIQRQVGALLMLPSSTRDRSRVSNGLPVVISKRFVIDEIQLANPTLAAGMATVRPTQVILRSNLLDEPDLVETVNVDARLDRLAAVYAAADLLPGALGAVVSAQRASLDAGVLGTAAESAVRSVMDALGSSTFADTYVAETDPLPALEALLGLAPLMEPVVPTLAPADDPEIRRRITTQRREQKIRGSASTKFRKEVQAAYDFRCCACGIRLPKGEHVARPGVDAAHILPWGEFDLDVVSNGLMLCKLHHWAFDEQLIVLETEAGAYRWRLSSRAEVALASDSETFMILAQVEGEIPESRLPSVHNKRPNPDYIAKLYEAVPPDA